VSQNRQKTQERRWERDEPCNGDADGVNKGINIRLAAFGYETILHRAGFLLRAIAEFVDMLFLDRRRCGRHVRVVVCHDDTGGWWVTPVLRCSIMPYNTLKSPVTRRM
jgi:hypothetical protein